MLVYIFITMGIPYYFSYLIKNHSAIISKLNALNNIHNLFIDSNSLIYDIKTKYLISILYGILVLLHQEHVL